MWHNLKDNIERGIGGRSGRLMQKEEFAAIFPENFFVKQENGTMQTPLGDYLELEHILPESEELRDLLFQMMEGQINACNSTGN